MMHHLRAIIFRPSLLVLILGLGVANLAASMWDAQVDLTSRQLYTLSDVSVQVVEQLDAPVHVDVYLSRELPAPLHTAHERLADLLDDYAHAASRDLTYTMHSPEQIASQALRQGCAKVAMGQRSQDALSVRAIFKCVVLRQGDATYVVPDLRLAGESETDRLELDLTRALHSLTRQSTRRVGVVVGLGGPADREGFMEAAKAVFQSRYGQAIEPVAVDLSRPESAEGLDALVILSVSDSVGEVGRAVIDQHIARGGSVGWYQSATVPDEAKIAQLIKELGPVERPPAIRRRARTGLDELFASYGVRHMQDVVLDPAQAVETVLWTNKGVTRAENPAIFKTQAINRELSFMANTSLVVWPAPSSLKLQVPEGVRSEPVITTSPTARSAEPPQTHNFPAMQRLSGVSRGPLVLAAVLEGEFPEYYAERPLPQGIVRRSSSLPKKSRLLVVGSGDFIVPDVPFGYDEALAGQGQQLFFDSLEWLVQAPELSQITRRRAPELLSDVPAATRWRVQVLHIIVVPLCMLLCGYAMLLRRRHRQEKLKRRASDP